MEAKDLRIGNLVYNENQTVVEIDIPRLSLLERKKVKYKPIPLTEEWLLKFGFKKEDEGSVSIQFHYGENPITRDYLISLIWIKDYKSNNNALEGFPFYRNGHFTIKTVNHLQNLFFALTGEELTLTEKP